MRALSRARRAALVVPPAMESVGAGTGRWLRTNRTKAGCQRTSHEAGSQDTTRTAWAARTACPPPSRLPAAPSGPASYLPKSRRVLVSIPRAALSPSRTPMRTTLEAAPEGPTAPPRCAQCAAGPGAPFWRARVREESRRVGDFRSRCRPRQIRMQRLLLEPREASHGGLRAASSGPAAGGRLGVQHHPSALGPCLCCRCRHQLLGLASSCYLPTARNQNVGIDVYSTNLFLVGRTDLLW